MTQGDRLWVRGLKGLVASIVATLAIRWRAVAGLDIPSDFPPLSGPEPTIFFTAVGAVGAMAVFAVVRRYSDRPEYLFRWIAAGVLLLSFLPDLWLLSDGAASAFAGATPTAVGVLMVMHVAAATAIVWFLTASGPGGVEEP